MHIADFQHAVMLWMEQCFGRATDGAKKGIRNFRFYEEATELVQAAGMTREEAHRQVDYTFDRPAGQPAQELGGVLVTLAAWAGTHGLQMSEHGPAELIRIDTPEMIAKIRAKQASKPGEGGPPRPTSDPVPPGVPAVVPAQQSERIPCDRCTSEIWCEMHGCKRTRGVGVVPDAAVLGWLNPDTGKTCSVDEKHSMEKHQGMPGQHIAKGFSIPLVAALGVTASRPAQIDESKLPPRPAGSNDANADPDSPLKRYGRASKESGLLLEPMADGYWTPWHIANEMLREAQRAHGVMASQESKEQP